MKKEVLVIFKTHLDIGYTNYASDVVKNYLDNYIPNAIKVGYELKGTDTPFIWTVGSWLIWEALKNDKDKRVENAIKDGIIKWHSLPYTSHTELMNEELFEYGLNISKQLDERFGVKTEAAKMTDVPGHTIAMLPLLEKYGVKFLHIGVNPASKVPPVPDVFKWEYKGSSINVMYQGAYGLPMEFEDFVVYFAHTNDNSGPQSKDEIIKIYDEIKVKYPDATVKAATLDDLAEKVCTLKNLPVIDKEIGDTWIHGAATDPEKLSRYRKLIRYIAENGVGDKDISDNLFLVPEHTWGVAIQCYFPFEKDYTYKEMEKYKGTAEYEKCVNSWEEQRDYVRNAEKLLGVTPDYPVKEFDLSGYTECDVADIPLEISWQLFSNKDIERYKNEYLRLTEKNMEWALWDYTKKGLQEYEGGIFTAKAVKIYKNENSKIFILEFDEKVKEEYGLPVIYVKEENEKYDVRWFGKKGSRLPQAYWLKFKEMEEKWELNKLGSWINPEEIIGSPLIAAINEGVRNKDVIIKSLDAAVVAPYGRKLYRYGCEKGAQDLYFVLYDNIWNTNFPMWYSDDGLFRFEIEHR